MDNGVQQKAAYLILTSAYCHTDDQDAADILRMARGRIIDEMSTSVFLDASDLAHLLVYSRY
jgi:hypothetical protein